MAALGLGLLLTFVSVCWCAALIPEFDDDVIDYIENNDYKSTSVGVMVDGNLVYVKGFTIGSESELGGDPMKLWPIGRISESITALAVMKLVDDGDLDLTETVFGREGILYDLKPFRNDGTIDSRIYDITVKDLLSHTSGWDSELAPLYDPGLNMQYLKQGIKVPDIRDELGTVGPLTTRHVIRYMLTQPLKYQPGTKSIVSVFHYGVLAEIIEEISGLDYAKFVKKYVFELCGMWNTHLGPAHVPSEPVDIDTSAAALGWYSNVFDLLRMMKCVDGTGRYRVLSEQTLKLMTERDEEYRGYEIWHGLGFMTNDHGSVWQSMTDSKNNALIWHSSMLTTLDEFQSPHQKISFVFLFESTSGDNLVNKHRLSQIVRDVINWPTMNLFTSDLSDVPTLSEGHVFKLTVPERHMKEYANALKMEYYDITWVSAAQDSTSTNFAVIAKPNPTGETYIVEVGLTKETLLDHQVFLNAYRYELQFLDSYISTSHGLNHRYLTISKKVKGATDTKLGLERGNADYKSSFSSNVKEGYVPKVQSVTHSKGAVSNNFLFVKKTTDNYKSYINMHLEEIDDIIEQNVDSNRVLHYLDVTSIMGVPVFSAIFAESPNTRGIFHKDLTDVEVLVTIENNNANKMVPKIVVGYTIHGGPAKYILYLTITN